MLNHPHVEVVTGFGARIVGTRIPVRRLWFWHRRGVTVATLVKRYPTAGPAKLLSALAFAYDNEELINEELAADDKLRDDEMKQLELPCPRKK